ncbi:hypothetical protein HCH_00611 [Hahella chejuensis KCTC 2396]|uniref:Knr4/Smi1-like domain-containing protein n=1 Tax=Hahella chejuensis (strain KCTC 2396) TaxID=349521 RepID=Q2SPB0_HAHCH|nr:SMI1/KNR4 family protein [Hahella chejuensis]ABC27514.1 hypothetical protein HCH_00611 [Hahella chejuensis KCTC 2396]
MIPEEKLPVLFDVLSWSKCEAGRPTESSIEKINAHYEITLPASLIRFMQASKYYADSLCLFDESYQSWNHIIRANSYYKNIRRRKGRRWCYVMPRHFVLIKAGHDSRNLVLDKSKYDPVTGEYGLQYWFPGYEIEFGDSYPDFNTYMRSLVEFLIARADEETQALCQAIVGSVGSSEEGGGSDL